MNYYELSDFEINKRVAMCVYNEEWWHKLGKVYIKKIIQANTLNMTHAKIHQTHGRLLIEIQSLLNGMRRQREMCRVAGVTLKAYLQGI